MRLKIQMTGHTIYMSATLYRRTLAPDPSGKPIRYLPHFPYPYIAPVQPQIRSQCSILWQDVIVFDMLQHREPWRCIVGRTAA